MPNLCLADFGQLPAPSKLMLDSGETSFQNTISSFMTNESLNSVNPTVEVSPFVAQKLLETSKQTNSPSSIGITTLETGKLRRFANSFSVQLPVIDFIVSPVQSLFSSFLEKPGRSKSGYEFAKSAYQYVLGTDIDMVI